MAEYEMILTAVEGRVAIIRLNRPKALNALCDPLMDELAQALRGYDADPPSPPSSSPGRRRPSLPAPTSRRCSPAPTAAVYLAISSASGGKPCRMCRSR